MSAGDYWVNSTAEPQIPDAQLCLVIGLVLQYEEARGLAPPRGRTFFEQGCQVGLFAAKNNTFGLLFLKISWP